MGADHLAFDFVDIVNGAGQHLGDRRKRCLLFLAELDHLPAVARDQQYVVDTVYAAHLGFELDVERAGRQGEVCRCEAQFARFVRDAAEIVVERLRPELPVGRKAHHEVGLDERVGGALCVALCAERELEVLRRYRDLLDREMGGDGREEDVVLARTVVERKRTFRRLVRTGRHALVIVIHVRYARTLVVDPARELVEVRPLAAVAVGLRGEFLVEGAVEDRPVGNFLFEFALVLDLHGDGIHIGLVRAEEPAGDGHVVAVVLLLEIVAHVIQAALY